MTIIQQLTRNRAMELRHVQKVGNSNEQSQMRRTS